MRLKKDRQNERLNSEYKQRKKQVSARISAARATYFKDEVKKSKSSKETWKIMNKMVPSRRNVKVEFDNPEEKAKQFNNFFANVGKNTYKKTQEILGIHNERDQQLTIRQPTIIAADNNNIPLFRPQPVAVEKVIKTINSLSNSNAFGIDGISTRFLKDSLFVIALYITVIINTSIVTGKYPSIWKHPLVDPFHKNGDKDDPSNFRPVSILPVLSKVIEKIVGEQLMEHLENNKLLSTTQHGFRKGLSTETALMKLTDEIYKNIDDKKISLLILCDLSKAFDSVNHMELLSTFNELYIDIFWFDDYLQDRVQAVRLGEVKSSFEKVEFGVPQGSVLGPVLFLIYINDMVKCINDCFLIQYADDSQVLLSDSVENLETLKERAELVLLKIKEYFLRKGLLMNASKTQCMFIGTSQYLNMIPNNIKIKCGNEEIISSNQVKNLGLYMDKHMTFNVHIDEISRKVSGILMYLNRIKDNFEDSTRVMIIQSLVLSVINYGIKLWGATNDLYLNKAQKLMNFAARVAVVGVRKHDHISPTLQQLQWLKIKDKYTYEVCLFAFKVLEKEYPNWLYEFPNVGSLRDTSTRQNSNLQVMRSRTELGSRSMLIRSPCIWNRLPKCVKDCSSTTIFKKKLKEHFLK